MKSPWSALSPLLCFLVLSTLISFAAAQPADQDSYEADRKRAFALLAENKFPDALPILEKLAVAKPDDAVVLERLALSLVIIASSSKKAPEQIVQDLKRARTLASKSKELGNDSQLIEMLLEKIPADGNAADFIDNKKKTPAEEAVLEGERAFSSGDLDKALEHYEQAAKLDPKLYDAPLFIGDVYFKKNQIDKAGEAYTRAIAIDPNRETAYRYWGNALTQTGKMKEAKEKLIEAVVAEPYNRVTWQFLDGWAQRNQLQIGHPQIDVPKSSVQRKDDKNINVLISALGKNDGSDAWTIYSIVKGGWMMGEPFKKEFPNEAKYRHSLPEEATALQATAESVENQIKEGKLKEKSLDPSIANLLKLHRAGLIEAYVLLTMPDAGITRDYPKYRQEHREKLRQYLTEFVVAGK